MSHKLLHLNKNKSETILFGSCFTETSWIIVFRYQTLISVTVIFDSDLSFEKQMLFKSCFCQLRNTANIKSFLSLPDLEKVIHGFISSQLDYCVSSSDLTQTRLWQPCSSLSHCCLVSFTTDLKVVIVGTIYFCGFKQSVEALVYIICIMYYYICIVPLCCDVIGRAIYLLNPLMHIL